MKLVKKYQKFNQVFCFRFSSRRCSVAMSLLKKPEIFIKCEHSPQLILFFIFLLCYVCRNPVSDLENLLKLITTVIISICSLMLANIWTKIDYWLYLQCAIRNAHVDTYWLVCPVVNYPWLIFQFWPHFYMSIL